LLIVEDGDHLIETGFDHAHWISRWWSCSDYGLDEGRTRKQENNCKRSA
jgi:hypothetical protein